jgi:NAD-dependent deacetylase
VRDATEKLAEMVAGGGVAVLTGAGISTESGIPDYRGPDGAEVRRAPMTYQTFTGDAAARRRYWARSHVGWRTIARAAPNAGHQAVAELQRRGLLTGMITQNVDGLHQAAGSSRERVVEVHGTWREVNCLSCGERAPMERALARVRAGEDDPPCRTCGGILKSATISFGQGLVPEDIARAQRAARECDLMLAIGTKLSVWPVAGVVPVAKDAGARVVILNAEPTDMDGLADVVLRGPIGEILPRLVAG